MLLNPYSSPVRKVSNVCAASIDCGYPLLTGGTISKGRKLSPVNGGS